MLKENTCLMLIFLTVTSLVFYFRLLTQLLMSCRLCVLRSPLLSVKAFCTFIIDIVSSSRELISPSAYYPSISVTYSAVPNQFEPVTLPCLEKSVNQIFPV